MASADFETIYVNGLLQLMKAYLNTNMCDEFAGVLLKEKVNPDFLKMNYDSDDALNSNKKNKHQQKCYSLLKQYIMPYQQTNFNKL